MGSAKRDVDRNGADAGEKEKERKRNDDEKVQEANGGGEKIESEADGKKDAVDEMEVDVRDGAKEAVDGVGGEAEGDSGVKGHAIVKVHRKVEVDADMKDNAKQLKSTKTKPGPKEAKRDVGAVPDSPDKTVVFNGDDVGGDGDGNGSGDVDSGSAGKCDGGKEFSPAGGPADAADTQPSLKTRDAVSSEDGCGDGSSDGNDGGGNGNEARGSGGPVEDAEELPDADKGYLAASSAGPQPAQKRRASSAGNAVAGAADRPTRGRSPSKRRRLTVPARYVDDDDDSDPAEAKGRKRGRRAGGAGGARNLGAGAGAGSGTGDGSGEGTKARRAKSDAEKRVTAAPSWRTACIQGWKNMAEVEPERGSFSRDEVVDAARDAFTRATGSDPSCNRKWRYNAVRALGDESAFAPTADGAFVLVEQLDGDGGVDELAGVKPAPMKGQAEPTEVEGKIYGYSADGKRVPPTWRDTAIASYMGLEANSGANGSAGSEGGFSVAELTDFVGENWDTISWSHHRRAQWRGILRQEIRAGRYRGQHVFIQQPGKADMWILQRQILPYLPAVLNEDDEMAKEKDKITDKMKKASLISEKESDALAASPLRQKVGVGFSRAMVYGSDSDSDEEEEDTRQPISRKARLLVGFDVSDGNGHALDSNGLPERDTERPKFNLHSCEPKVAEAGYAVSGADIPVEVIRARAEIAALPVTPGGLVGGEVLAVLASGIAGPRVPVPIPRLAATVSPSNAIAGKETGNGLDSFKRARDEELLSLAEQAQQADQLAVVVQKEEELLSPDAIGQSSSGQTQTKAKVGVQAPHPVAQGTEVKGGGATTEQANVKDREEMYRNGWRLFQLHSHGSKAAAAPRNMLPPQAVATFKAWASQHSDHPYPNEEEKRCLAAETRTTLIQVTNWFINHRSRVWRPASKNTSQFKTFSLKSRALLRVPITGPNANKVPANAPPLPKHVKDHTVAPTSSAVGGPVYSLDGVMAGGQSHVQGVSLTGNSTYSYPEATANPAVCFVEPSTQAGHMSHGGVGYSGYIAPDVAPGEKHVAGQGTTSQPCAASDSYSRIPGTSHSGFVEDGHRKLSTPPSHQGLKSNSAHLTSSAPGQLPGDEAPVSVEHSSVDGRAPGSVLPSAATASVYAIASAGIVSPDEVKSAFRSRDPAVHDYLRAMEYFSASKAFESYRIACTGADEVLRIAFLDDKLTTFILQSYTSSPSKASFDVCKNLLTGLTALNPHLRDRLDFASQSISGWGRMHGGQENTSYFVGQVAVPKVSQDPKARKAQL